MEGTIKIRGQEDHQPGPDWAVVLLTPDVMVNIIKQFVFLHHKRFLSLHYAHVWLNLVVFPEVSLSLDCLVEEGEDDDQQKSVENTENGKTTGLWVRTRTCSNKYLHLQNIGERRSTLAL